MFRVTKNVFRDGFELTALGAFVSMIAMLAQALGA